MPLLFQSGCAVPPLNVVPTLPVAPTISDLQKHVTCQLAKAMNDHLSNPADHDLWQHLIDYNVLDTINLTLFVTQTQGLNPSINFITPLTSLGKPIEKVIESSNGLNNPMNVTSNSNNFTLAVGFQLSGTEDRNFVMTYVVDLHRLYNEIYLKNDKGAFVRDVKGNLVVNPDGKLGDCFTSKGDKPGGAFPYGLKGDLELSQTLSDGLRALDDAPFAPITSGSAKTSGGGATIAQSASATAFSSKFDFTLMWGVGGGPSWNLLKVKAGAAGSSGQLVSYTRQKTDSMISTFSATCKSDQSLDVNDGRDFYLPVFKNETLKSGPTYDAFSVSVYRRRTPKVFGNDADDSQSYPGDPLPAAELAGNDEAGLDRDVSQIIKIYIAIPRDKSGLSYAYVGNGAGIMTVLDLPKTPNDPAGPKLISKTGTITWSAYVSSAPPSSPPGQSPVPFSFSLHGTVADTQSGTPLGYANIGITLGGPNSPVGTFELSDNAIRIIDRETNAAPQHYWESLPSCSNSGPFQSNGLNVLQQLSPDTRSTLLQANPF